MTLKGSEANHCIDKTGKMYDFVSRYFAPWVGIPEDPVTGRLICKIQVRKMGPDTYDRFLISLRTCPMF